MLNVINNDKAYVITHLINFTTANETCPMSLWEIIITDYMTVTGILVHDCRQFT